MQQSRTSSGRAPLPVRRVLPLALALVIAFCGASSAARAISLSRAGGGGRSLLQLDGMVLSYSRREMGS